MNKQTLIRIFNLTAVSIVIGLFFIAAGLAHSAQIVVTTTIQAAVDQANPGDTISVPPGIYRENITVTKANLTIRGSRGAVLDGAGLGNNGIRVASAIAGETLDGFVLDGLTIQNYPRNGVVLVQVNNYGIANGIYKNNARYAIFPIRSDNGVVEGNQTSGSEDSGIYIGQSRFTVVRNNICFNNTVGIEIENTTDVQAVANLVRDNSVGIAAFVLPGLNVKVLQDILIERNTVTNNNRPNLITDPNDVLSLVPDGMGIFILGGDRITVRNNRVVNSNSIGIGVASVPQALAERDPNIDPAPDTVLVTSNNVLHSGSDPDERIAPLPGVDLAWDLTGSGNHWANNVYQTSFPPQLP